jgi:hypothetical protein
MEGGKLVRMEWRRVLASSETLVLKEPVADWERLLGRGAESGAVPGKICRCQIAMAIIRPVRRLKIGSGASSTEGPELGEPWATSVVLPSIRGSPWKKTYVSPQYSETYEDWFGEPKIGV